MRKPDQGPPSHWITGWVPGLPSRLIDLDFHIPSLLHRAGMANYMRLRPALHRRGLTEAQWRLLRVLESTGLSLSMKEIVGLSGSDDKSVRKMAGLLGSRGFVHWRDTPDAVRRGNAVKRGRWLALDPPGRELIWRVRRGLRASFVDPVPRFSLRDGTRLDRRLTGLVEAGGLILPHGPFPPLEPTPFYPALDDPAGWSQAAIHELDLGLPLRLRRVFLALRARLRPILLPHGLTEPHWRCLRIFQFFTNPISKTAARRAGCFQPGGVLTVLELLHERGLIEYDFASRFTKRQRIRTRCNLRISRGGRRLIERVEADEARVLGEAQQRLTADAVDELRALLSKFIGASLWTPDHAGDELPVHPLDAIYAEGERKSVEQRRDQRAAERTARRHGRSD